MKKLGIPNMLSIFRLILLPIFVVLYFALGKEYRYVCAIIWVVSGLTDVLDGFIARKFHMESDLGRFLDPLADKLTLFVISLTLAIGGYRNLYILAGILFLKELFMLIGGVVLAKKCTNNKLVPSKWYGKLATVVLYIVMFAMILIEMNKTAEIILACIMCAVAIFAFVMYLRVYINMRKAKTIG